MGMLEMWAQVDRRKQGGTQILPHVWEP